MSKTKATPRKKTPKPKKAAASAPSPVAAAPAEAPMKLEREDQLILQLALSERTNKQFQLKNASQEMEDSNANWNKQLQAVNTKYDLNPETDKIDLGTGIIQKG